MRRGLSSLFNKLEGVRLVPARAGSIPLLAHRLGQAAAPTRWVAAFAFPGPFPIPLLNSYTR